MQEILDKFSPDSHEIEVRFGTFNTGNRFTPSIKDDEYRRIMMFLKSNSSFYTYSIEEQIVENLSDSIRKLKVGDSTTFNKKTVIQKYDEKDWGFRIAVSKEEATKETKKKALRIVKRTRHTFVNIKNKIKIDLDVEIETDKKTVEIECLPGCKYENLQKETTLMIKIIQETEYPAPYPLLHEALQYYKILTRKEKFVGVQPKTLTDEKFDKKKNYAITKKLDGQRFLMMPYNGQLYSISSKMKVTWTPYSTTLKDSGYIFDTELYGGYYHIFDILNPGKGDLKSRLQESQDFLKTVVVPKGLKKIVIKEYFFTKDLKDLYDTFKKLEKTLDPKVYDGLILVQTEGGYQDSSPLKWKPVIMNTVDFRIKKSRGNKFELQVGVKEGLQTFATTEVTESEYKRYSDGDIVEFSFRNERWVPLKHRMDKPAPNFITVAEDNFRAVISPFSPETTFFSNNALHNMRRFHNYIKRNYIDKYKGSFVLDLACGKGGDFGKYVDSGFNKIFGFDINKDSIKEATARASAITKKKGENVEIKLETRDLIKMHAKLDTNVDLVVCNFAFHYFYNNLDSFLKSVDLNLKKGGYLLLTFFDGSLVKEMKTKDYEIKKVGLDKISVWMKDSVLSKKELEYIVDVENVISVFQKAGLSIQEKVNFKKLYDSWSKIGKNSLTKQEKDLSFMNNVMVFKKT